MLRFRLLYVIVLKSNVYDACVCVCVCVRARACVCMFMHVCAWFICIIQRNWACLTWKSAIEIKSLSLSLIIINSYSTHGCCFVLQDLSQRAKEMIETIDCHDNKESFLHHAGGSLCTFVPNGALLNISNIKMYSVACTPKKIFSGIV